MNTPRSASLLASLTLGAVLLTGCTEEAPQPKFAEQPNATPTPVEKEESAEEFIRRWNRADAAMQNSGSTADYRAITKKCAPCTALADQVDEFYTAGGYVATEGREIENIKRLDSSSFLVWIKAGPTTYRESTAGPEGSYPGGEDLLRVTVTRRSGEFQLTDVVRQPR